MMLEIQLRITWINYILKYIKIEKLFKIVIIFYIITLFLVFFLDQINAVLVSRIYFFQKHKKTYPSLYLFICILLYILIYKYNVSFKSGGHQTKKCITMTIETNVEVKYEWILTHTE